MIYGRVRIDGNGEPCRKGWRQVGTRRHHLSIPIGGVRRRRLWSIRWGQTVIYWGRQPR